MSDNFEDFEFKPLTQGLGFHKKTVDLGKEEKKAEVTSTLPKRDINADSINRMISSIPTFDNPAAPVAENFFSPPLPREELPSFRSPRYQEISKKTIIEPALSPKVDFAVSNRVSAEPVAPVLAEVGFSISAFIFDSLVVVGLTSLFTGIVLAITQADFGLVIQNAQTDLTTRLSLVLLVLSVIELYLVLSRSFFGSTLGEWAFDIELGNTRQQKSAWYPIAVAWRTLLIMLTGFVLLPLISLILGKDVPGKLSGPRLYRKN